MPTERRTQAERRAATRAQLLDAARELFVEQGYAQTGTPQIVARAGVTRGALYHHFADKADLFRGVCEREAHAVADAIEDATRETGTRDTGTRDTSTRDTSTHDTDDPMQALRLGTDAYLDAMSVPRRARLLLLDAPAVLGPSEALELTRSDGNAALREGLARARPDVGDAELDALTDVLSAAFDRAALAIANGAERGAYRDAMARLIGF